MTKPSSTLPVLYARVPVETYALAQLLAGEGKTSVSRWLIDLIESQRGTLGGQPLPPYAQPAQREFTFAFDETSADKAAQGRAVRLADWILRMPDIRERLLWTNLSDGSVHAYVGARPIDFLARTMDAFKVMRDIVVICPNGIKAQVFEVRMSDDPMLDHRVGVCITRSAAEIWEENDHEWWEMVRKLPRILLPQFWAAVAAHEAKTQQAIAVASANAHAEHEPGYAVAAVAPVKRGRGRPRKVVATDREDGHQRAAEAACSSGDE